jgi:hypothetical protein
VSLSRWWRQARHIRNLTIRLNAKGEELYGAHRRIAELSEGRGDNADLRVADARIADLTEELAQANRRTKDAETKHKDAYDRVLALEKQLDAGVETRATKARIADQHAQVSALPPALNRDRANANRYAAENVTLRAEIEELRRKYEGNPS